MMPLPAVIHSTSPAAIVPGLPAVAANRTREELTFEEIKRIKI
jgi:hypothetical protein